MPPTYTITELADLAGVTPRTVRYYLAQGLLPAVGQPGPGAKYGDDHLARLRLIRRLQREHLPLAEIRRRLEGLADEEVAALADESPRAPETSALDYIRDVLRPPPGYRLRRVAEAGPPPAGFPGAYPAPAHTPAEPPTLGPERSQWERIVLVPDVELHVRRPLDRPLHKRVDRIIRIARDILEEGES